MAIGDCTEVCLLFSGVPHFSEEIVQGSGIAKEEEEQRSHWRVESSGDAAGVPSQSDETLTKHSKQEQSHLIHKKPGKESCVEPGEADTAWAFHGVIVISSDSGESISFHELVSLLEHLYHVQTLTNLRALNTKQWQGTHSCQGHVEVGVVQLLAQQELPMQMGKWMILVAVITTPPPVLGCRKDQRRWKLALKAHSILTNLSHHANVPESKTARNRRK